MDSQGLEQYIRGRFLQDDPAEIVLKHAKRVTDTVWAEKIRNALGTDSETINREKEEANKRRRERYAKEYDLLLRNLHSGDETKLLLSKMLLINQTRRLKYKEFRPEYAIITLYAEIRDFDIDPFRRWLPFKRSDKMLERTKRRSSDIEKIIEGLKPILPNTYRTCITKEDYKRV